jgi:hypothetical protein
LLRLDISRESRQLGDLAGGITRPAALIGAIGLVVSALGGLLIEGGATRFFQAYLVNYAYFLSLALGALFWVMLQHLTRSGWSVVVRRLGETLAATLPVLAVLFIPILIGVHYLYHWADAEAVTHNELMQHKQPYLNVPFFVIRAAVYLIVWVVLAEFFFRRSLQQDATGDVRLTLRMQKASAPAMVLFAFTVTFASFDWLMSPDAHWYSTIFGVYYFSGGVVGFFGLLIVVALLLQRAGRLTHVITAEHYHDLGKLLFAFVVFWAYIAFSQYMLIWYANIPEETTWYLARQTGEWTTISLTLLFGHFVLPFLLLLSRFPKRRPRLLLLPAAWMLIMHWLDIYWLVMPGASPGRFGLHWQDITCFVGIGGLFIAAAVQRLGQRSLVPERDPRLAESLVFENA